MRKYLSENFPIFFGCCKKFKRTIRIFFHKRYSKQQMENYLSKKYKIINEYEMDWSNPKSYTQKIQYSKLYNNQKLRTTCSDKVLVREYVKNKIGENYLIPIYGIWKNANDINFDKLPSKFVLKTNHGSATNIIVKDKSKIDVNKVKKQMNEFLKDDFAYYGFELHYKDIKPLIYAEELLEFENNGIEDYKFLCFDGNIYCFWIDFDRNTNHKRNMYDLNWNLLPWNQWNYGNYEGKVDIPDNFNEMIEIVKKLSEGFDHVRVDLYNTKGKIYFGELTFTNGGGFEKIYPKEMDFELGKQWNLELNKK